MPNKNLELQRMKLQLAAGYATTIETCDSAIEEGREVEYFTNVRTEAIEKYAEAVRDLIESFINISACFQTEPDSLFMEIAKIVRKDAKDRLGISIE